MQREGGMEEERERERARKVTHIYSPLSLRHQKSVTQHSSLCPLPLHCPVCTETCPTEQIRGNLETACISDFPLTFSSSKPTSNF